MMLQMFVLFIVGIKLQQIACYRDRQKDLAEFHLANKMVTVDKNSLIGARANNTLDIGIVLSYESIVAHYDANNRKMLIARIRSTGVLCLFIGNAIHRVTISNNRLVLFLIAYIEDANESTSEFEVEIYHAHNKKSYWIVCLYLDDRYQIYQISIDETSLKPVKAVQKIRRYGKSSKTVMIWFLNALYLFAGYKETDSGKIVIYRWLDFHFSLEDTKDVPIHHDIVVHSGNQLVFLILEYAEYPEHSINHIYMLNEQRKIMKTQEMFFLFNRLPYYEVADELYVLRCLAPGKCFLYKWNNESLFLRVCKTELDPRYIELVGYGYNVTIVSYNENMHFYYNEPLLKTSSAIAIVDQQNKIVDTQFYMRGQVDSSIYLYKEQTTGEIYMCILYNRQHTMITCHKIHIVTRPSSDTAPGSSESGDFSALRLCIDNIKKFLDWRKRWIHLIKYQIGKIPSVYDKPISTTKVNVSSVYIQKSNVPKHVKVNGNLYRSPRSLYERWYSLKTKITSTHTRAKDVLLVNKINEIHSNIKIQGNLQTKAANMDNLTVQHTVITQQRYKRYIELLRHMEMETINTMDILYNGLLFKNLLFYSKPNCVYNAVHVKKIVSISVQLSNESINRLPILQIVSSDYSSWIKGNKQLLAVDAENAAFSLIRGQFSTQLVAESVNIEKFIKSKKLEGNYNIDNLSVSDSFNKAPVSNILFVHDSDIILLIGNLTLWASCNIRNVHTNIVNAIVVNNIFDYKTNQSIFTNVHMRKVYTENLQTQYFNALVIPEHTTSVNFATLKKVVLVSSFVVLHDLWLSSVDQHVNNYFLAGKPHDFSQLYTGRVFVRGSLFINKMITKPCSHVFVNGLKADTSISDYFWMKQVTQNVSNFAFHRYVVVWQLICNELNYYEVSKYFQTGKWQTHQILHFSETYVKGNVTIFLVNTKRILLHNLYGDAVQRRLSCTLFNRKRFTDLLETDELVLKLLDSIRVQQMLSAPKIHTTTLIINDCNVSLIRNVHVQNMQHRNFTDIIINASNIRDVQSIRCMIILNFQATYLKSNDHYGNKNILSKAYNFMDRTNFIAENMKIETVKISRNMISVSHLSTTYVNTINVNEYKMLLTCKNHYMLKHREIGGNKYFQSGLVFSGSFHAGEVNDRRMDILFEHATRKTIPQNILGIWIFIYAESNYIISKQINRVRTGSLMNVNLSHLEIGQDMFLGGLMVSAKVNGNITTIFSKLSMPPKMRLNTLDMMQGHLPLQHHSRYDLFNMLYFGVTYKTRFVNKKTVFYGRTAHISNMNGTRGVLSRKNNFSDLTMDSVSKTHASLLFTGAKRKIQMISCAFLAKFIVPVKNATINLINLMQLNENVHLLGYHKEIINTTKYFKSKPQVIHFTCKEQLAVKIYLQNLMAITKVKRAIGNQYLFQGHTKAKSNVFVEVINEFSVQHFMIRRMLINDTHSRKYMNNSLQQTEGLYMFSELIIAKDLNRIQSLNGVSINDMLIKHSSDLQIISETKWLHGNATFIGPLSAILCNTHSILDLCQSSYLLRKHSFCRKQLTFNDDCVLHAGVLIEEAINGFEKQKLKYYQHALEVNLTTTPKILNTLLITTNRARNDSFKTPDLYKRNTVDVYQSESSKSPKLLDMSLSIIITNASNDAEQKFNLTICKESLCLRKKDASAIIKGNPVQTEWTTISSSNEQQLLIFVLSQRIQLYVLSLYIYQFDQVIQHQLIDMSSFTSSFQVMHDTENTVLLALFESMQMHGDVLGKLELYRFQSDEMKLLHLQTIHGIHNTVMTIVVDEKILLIITEQESNVLLAYLVDRAVCSIYQKIIFNSVIISVTEVQVGGKPAVRVETADMMFHVYEHSALEGWKQYSYGSLKQQMR